MWPLLPVKVTAALKISSPAQVKESRRLDQSALRTKPVAHRKSGLMTSIPEGER